MWKGKRNILPKVSEVGDYKTLHYKEINGLPLPLRLWSRWAQALKVN